MTCEDCENKVPDRTVDNNCSDGINDAILGKISDAAVGPVSTGAGNRGGLTADAASPISYISNAVRNISKRFGTPLRIFIILSYITWRFNPGP